MNLVEEHRGALNLALGKIAFLLGISEAHLYRLFKQSTGITFRRYLREVRIRKAMEKLCDQAKSIKQIADESGYSDISNFYHDFVKFKGLTPRQYRVKLLDKQIDDLVKTKGARKLNIKAMIR